MEEIEAWPGYKKDVDPTSTKVARLVGVYSGFAAAVPCGLTCCHTLHKTGVVVETVDGDITNIGHVCGAKYFEEYQVIKNRYDANVARSRRLRVLRDLLNSEPALRTRLANLKTQPYAADWLHNSWRNFIESVPSVVVNELRERALRDNGRVTRTERLHGEAAERRRQFVVSTTAGREGGAPIYEERELGHIRGLGIWRDRNIREVLFDGVVGRLDKVRELDLPSLSASRLRDWAEWAESIEALLVEAETLIREGRLFFTQENLALVADVWTDQTAAAVRNLKWDYRAGKAGNPASRVLRWR
jgi:hypothetical protein